MSGENATAPIGRHGIPSFPGYWITSNGDVWSRRKSGFGVGMLGRWKLLSPALTKNKRYLFVGLMRDGRVHPRYVHRLVAETFIGPCPEGMQVAHNNGNGRDNRVENLRYDTAVGNTADKFLHGTMRRGEQIVQSKLTEEGVRRIRDLAGRGIPLVAIARQTGSPYSTVYKVANRLTWRHVV